MGRRNSYTEEFKREAVARAVTVGLGPTKVCEELFLIHNWRKNIQLAPQRGDPSQVMKSLKEKIEGSKKNLAIWKKLIKF